METIISIEDYAKRYIPFGPFILIQKHKLPEKTSSGIYVGDQKTREQHLKWAMSGTLLAKSAFNKFEHEWEAYLMSVLKVGDWVGFNSTSPITSPAPPWYKFAGEDSDAQDLCTIHAGDVVAVLAQGDDELNAIHERFAYVG